MNNVSEKLEIVIKALGILPNATIKSILEDIQAGLETKAVVSDVENNRAEAFKAIYSEPFSKPVAAIVSEVVSIRPDCTITLNRKDTNGKIRLCSLYFDNAIENRTAGSKVTNLRVVLQDSGESILLTPEYIESELAAGRAFRKPSGLVAKKGTPHETPYDWIYVDANPLTTTKI
jgi:hypothetical protein